MPEYQTTANDVQSIFSSIASRYDLANSVLSMGTHHSWRRKLLALLPQSDKSHNTRVLDLCCGTGDFVALLERQFRFVVGADFCSPMLKASAGKRLSSTLLQADGLKLPFADDSFDLVTVGFGVRNFENLAAGLKEIQRVIKPGGKVLILEFGTPVFWFRPFYAVYARFVMPYLGSLITGNKAAYTYLPQTSLRFPYADKFCELLKRSDFNCVKFKSLTFGIAYAYYGQKIA